MANVNVTPSLLKGYNTTVFTKADVTAATAWTTANSPITIFTVTGTVKCRIYGVVGSVAFNSAGGPPGTGTLALGIASSTGFFMAATTANGTTAFPANAPWADATVTALAHIEVSPNSLNTYLSTNVILTIATNNMTAGSMSIFCDWIPVTAGATVV